MAKAGTGATLSREEAARGFDTMMSGEATPSQMGALLMALRVRGETVDEITGAVSAMREKMLRVVAPPDAIDVVGTGGDASGSVNISACAALVVAGAGRAGGAGRKHRVDPRRCEPLHQTSRHRLHVRARAPPGDEECRPYARRARYEN